MSLNLLTLLTLGQVLGGPEFSVQQSPSRPAEFSFAAPTVAPSSVDASTVVLWHFDDGAGVPTDSAGNVTGLSVNGTFGTGVGIYSASAYLRGSSGAGSNTADCATGTSPAALNSALLGEYTVAFWFNRTTSRYGGETYFDELMVSDNSTNFARSIAIIFDATNSRHIVQWATGSGTYATVTMTTAGAIPTGGWHHYAATVTSTGGGSTRTLKWYVDGVLTDTNTGLGAPNVAWGGTQKVWLGCGEANNNGLSGGLDDMIIASRALTAAEVLALYRQSGRWSSPPPPTKGPSMTFTRASTATYEAQQGHVINALSGEMRCGYRGCLIEPSRTNIALQSSAFDAAVWGGDCTTSLTVTANQAAGLDGITSADQLAIVGGGSGECVLYQAVSTTIGAYYTLSVWLRTVTGTATTYLGLNPGGAAGNSAFSTCSVTTTWSLCSLTAQASLTGTEYWTIGWDMRAGNGAPTPAGVTATLLVWNAQMEAGGFATSPIPTAGTAVTRVADVLSVPSSVLGTSAASFRLTLFPEWASSATGTNTLLDSDVASELALSVASDAMSWAVNANTVTTAGTLGWSALATKTLDSSYSATGNYSATDGTRTALGTNPGNPTPATLYLGGSSTVGGGVYISSLKICKRSGTCRR